MLVKGIFKVFYFTLLIVIFVAGSWLLGQRIVNAYCLYPGGGVGCPNTNPCGVGKCTQWLFCSNSPTCNNLTACLNHPNGCAEYSCYNPVTCPGGGTTCGTCSGGSGSPPPGSGTCNNNGICDVHLGEGPGCDGCGYNPSCPWTDNGPYCVRDGDPCGNPQWSSTYGGYYCPGNPEWYFCCPGLWPNAQGTCVCPTCNPVAPNPATINSPANNEILPSNNVTLSYVVNNGWGNGCPTSTSYRVMVSENCTSTYVSYGATSSLSNLKWGTPYCWYVEKNNRLLVSWSVVHRFVINSPPTLVDSGFTSDVCGNGWTGRADQPGTTNPLEFWMRYTDPEGDTFHHTMIAFVPENSFGNTATISQVLTRVRETNSLGGYMYAPNILYLHSYTTDTGPHTSGDVTTVFGTSTAMGIGVDTRSVNNVAENYFESWYRFRIENSMTTRRYDVYALMLTETAPGVLVSSDATSTDNYVYRRVYSGWGIDTTLPSGTITPPSYDPVTNNFSLTWSWGDGTGSGIVPQSVRSKVSSDIAGVSLSRINPASGQIDFSVANQDYPSDPSMLISLPATSPVTQTYRDLSPATGASYTFKLNAIDNACNAMTTVSRTVRFQGSWVVGYQGNVSSSQGINIKVPDITNYESPMGTIPKGFLSSNLALYQTIASDLDKISDSNRYSGTYKNYATHPKIEEGITNWYGTLRSSLIQNEKNISQFSAGSLNWVYNPAPPPPTCPVGTIQYGTSCYKLQTTSMTWQEAQFSCGRNGGSLVTINDSAENEFLKTNFQIQSNNTWIGYTDNAIEGSWEWVVGTSSFTNWYPSYPNGGTSSNCARTTTTGGLAQWIDAPCNSVYVARSVCEIPLNEYVDISCPDSTWVKLNNRCYWKGSHTGIWTTTRSSCTSLGGDLATINSLTENKFVYHTLHVKSYTESKAWIGLNDITTEGNFVWVNGDPVIYTNWNTGEPNDWGGNEDCTVVGSSSAGHRWNDELCTKGLSGICMYKIDVTIPGEETSNFSQVFNVPTNSKLIAEITGNVSIPIKASCDVQGLIFVNGNLSIEPDFNLVSSNGCAFIVNGNITIGKGLQKTNTALGSPNPSVYDVLHGFFVTDGTFTAVKDDDAGAPNKWDGLYIIGGVRANTLQLQRNLNTTANSTQPAMIINFDPRYIELFKTDLTRTEFSIREVER